MIFVFFLFGFEFYSVLYPAVTIYHFFFHMPNLCSYLSDNQIENLPPGVFTNNTELTDL